MPKTFFLKAGEVWATDKHYLIKTVLGSCVSVFLHDKMDKVSGANHYLLTYAWEKNDRSCKYGEFALPRLLDSVEKEGGKRKFLTAQIVGGAYPSDSLFQVGEENVTFAEKWLQEKEIPLIFRDTGGNRGRFVSFDTKRNVLETKKLLPVILNP